MSTPMVDLRQVSMLAEIVLRGGDFSNPRSRVSLRMQYEQPKITIPTLLLGSPAFFVPVRHLTNWRVRDHIQMPS